MTQVSAPLQSENVFVLETIPPSMREQYLDDIVSFYELRHKVFVEELAWDLPLAKENYEIDEFDRPDTTYILIKSASGRVVAGMRLLPTTAPHLLARHFGFLVDRDLPQGPDVYESSRSCVAPDLRGTSSAKPIYGMLILGVIGYCVENAIRQLTFVADESFFKKLASKLPVAPLGQVMPYKSQMLAAGLVQMNQEALEIMRAALGGAKAEMFRAGSAA